MTQPHDASSSDGHIHELTPDEARDLFDGRARYHLGISGEQFVKRWSNGHYADRTEDPHVISVAMLLPLVGVDPRQQTA